MDTAEKCLSNDKKETSRTFSGRMGVPQIEREEYERLRTEYARLDVPWVDDEGALAAWIVKRHPDFLKTAPADAKDKGKDKGALRSTPDYLPGPLIED